MSAELPTAGDTNTDASHSSSLSDGNLSESASVESTEPIDESLNSSDLKFDPDDQNVYYPVFALTEVPQEVGISSLLSATTSLTRICSSTLTLCSNTFAGSIMITIQRKQC